MTDTVQKTPWHLWLVGGALTLWSGFGAFDFIATITHFEPYLSQFPQEMLDYFYALPPWIFVIWAVGIGLGLAGAIALLMRRRIAAPLLAGSTVGAFGSLICSLMNPPPEAMADPIMGVVIVAVALLSVLYAFWMRKRGVLR
jgi:hypothetical protein